VRTAWALSFLAAVLHAQDVLDPPHANWNPGGAIPGAKARVAEELDALKRALGQDAANLAALERALALAERMGRVHLVEKRVLAALVKRPDDPALHGLLGYALWKTPGNRTGIVLPANLRNRDIEDLLKQLNRQELPKLRRCELHLRKAVRGLEKDARCRETLADVLGGIDKVKHSGEIKKLRQDAATLRGAQLAAPAPIDLHPAAERLRAQAEELEGVPKHDEALALRRRALVLDWCSHTIGFEPDAALWEPVALLADENMVRENLTRTFVAKSGETATVEVQYYAPPPLKRIEVVRALGKRGDANAAAALLGLLRRAYVEGTLYDETIAAAAAVPATKDSLGELLATAILSDDHAEYRPIGRRLLVRLAGTMRLAAAAGAMRIALERDTDLFVPLGAAAALAELGQAEDANRLLARARDAQRALHVRREAAYALGRLAPERLGELADVPDVALAVAAARYRNDPTNRDALQRILAGFDNPHEADDAANYAAELKIRAALGAIDTFLSENADHYAAADIKAARQRLR
jgi:hypothetical protein